MSTSITGVKKSYTSGDTVSCVIDVPENILRRQSIISSEISISKRVNERRQNGMYMTYGVDGKPEWYHNYVFDTKYETISMVETTVTHAGRYNVSSNIPEDTMNSCIKVCDTIGAESTTFYDFGILVKIQVRDNGGKEDTIESFKVFDLRCFTPAEKTPMDRYLWGAGYSVESKNIPKKSLEYSAMMRSNTSSFKPGETVVVDVVCIKKSSSSTLFSKSKIKGWDNKELVVKKYRTKYLPDLNLNDDAEIEYMKNALSRGEGNRFVFKLPTHMYGGSDRNLEFVFQIKSLNIRYSRILKSVMFTGGPTYQIFLVHQGSVVSDRDAVAEEGWEERRQEYLRKCEEERQVERARQNEIVRKRSEESRKASIEARARYEALLAEKKKKK